MMSPQVVGAAHHNKKKVFTTVSGELLLPLMACSFPGGSLLPKPGSGEGSRPRSCAGLAAADEARRLLHTALLTPAHVAGLAAAAMAAVAAEPAQCDTAQHVSSARQNPNDPEPAQTALDCTDKAAAPKHYHRLLFTAVAGALHPESATFTATSIAPLLHGLPWLLRSFCAASEAFARLPAKGTSRPRHTHITTWSIAAGALDRQWHPGECAAFAC